MGTGSALSWGRFVDSCRTSKTTAEKIQKFYPKVRIYMNWILRAAAFLQYSPAFLQFPCSIPAALPQYSHSVHPVFMLQLSAVFLQYSCSFPAISLQYSCSNLGEFLQHSCSTPAVCLCISAIFLQHSCSITGVFHSIHQVCVQYSYRVNAI